LTNFSTNSAGEELGKFKLTLETTERVSTWLVMAWADINKNERMDWDEPRATEYFQITKMDGTFFGFRASGSVLAPLATTSVTHFGDATKVKSYRFAFPFIEEPPVATDSP